MTIAENLDTFLADFGVIISGSVSGIGILDMPDQEIGGGMSLSSEYSVIGKFSVLGGLTHGDPLTVEGVNYSVREVRKHDDGKFCRVILTKV